MNLLHSPLRAARHIALATAGAVVFVLQQLWSLCSIALQLAAVPLEWAIDKLGESRAARWARKTGGRT